MPHGERVVIYLFNDGTIRLVGLKDATTDAFINDAVVTATLYKGRDILRPIATPGAAVTGFNALSMSYIALSEGEYQGNISDDFGMTGTTADPGANYVLVIRANRSGLIGQFENSCTVESASLPVI